MKNYKEYIIQAEPFIPDILTGFLWELEISGITEENDRILVFSEEDKISLNAIEEKLQKLVEDDILAVYKVQEKTIENKNWNEEWEKSINVIEVSDRVVIKPTFRNYDAKENQLVITIDPKMSFGTGEHQTTRLVIRLLEKYINENKKVLDVGTGTGVLAIAAILLGAKSASAFDIDEWSTENGIENAKLNNVEDKIDFFQCEITDVNDKNFDLILANIQKNILLEISDDIKSKSAKHSTLILSGLLEQDEKDIVEKYSSLGFQFVEKTQADEWIALVFVTE